MTVIVRTEGNTLCLYIHRGAPLGGTAAMWKSTVLLIRYEHKTKPDTGTTSVGFCMFNKNIFFIEWK